jgi:hypothetical protein
MTLLIKNRVDLRRLGTNSGHHNLLDVVTHEEPGLLEFEILGERIRVAHDSDSDLTIRDTSDECFDAVPASIRTRESGSAVVGCRSRNERPVPGRRDIFVFVSVDVGILRAIREMKASCLRKNQIVSTVTKKQLILTFSELVHSVFLVLEENILMLVK